MNWFSYLGICLLTTFSPGPAVILALNNTLSAGSKVALYSSFGNALGILCLASGSLCGVNYLLQVVPELLTVFKYVGAAYLLYLSGRMLWQSQLQLAFGQATQQPKHAAVFRQGFLLALSNPKSLLFFFALFPQFGHASSSHLSSQIFMLLIFTGSALLSHSVYILAAGWIGRRYLDRKMPFLLRLIPAICLAGFAYQFLPL